MDASSPRAHAIVAHTPTPPGYVPHITPQNADLTDDSYRLPLLRAVMDEDFLAMVELFVHWSHYLKRDGGRESFRAAMVFDGRQISVSCYLDRVEQWRHTRASKVNSGTVEALISRAQADHPDQTAVGTLRYVIDTRHTSRTSACFCLELWREGWFGLVDDVLEAHA